MTTNRQRPGFSREPYIFHKGRVAFQGEIVRAKRWLPEFGKPLDAATEFRVVLLEEADQDLEAPPDPAVAVCVQRPAAAPHSVRESRAQYLVTSGRGGSQELNIGAVITSNPVASSLMQSKPPPDLLQALASALVGLSIPSVTARQFNDALPYIRAVVQDMPSASSDRHAGRLWLATERRLAEIRSKTQEAQ